MSKVDEKISKRNKLKYQEINHESPDYLNKSKRMKQQRAIRDRRAAKRSVTHLDDEKEALGKGSVNW